MIENSNPTTSHGHSDNLVIWAESQKRHLSFMLCINIYKSPFLNAGLKIFGQWLGMGFVAKEQMRESAVGCVLHVNARCRQASNYGSPRIKTRTGRERARRYRANAGGGGRGRAALANPPHRRHARSPVPPPGRDNSGRRPPAHDAGGGASAAAVNQGTGLS
ncbi:hypothetical protein EVAR_62474_1 [Eumeta japonica]|uniref:Uncharacterized protein n=1 Tax=Eumeta variegata TaxID=151549 RepID=A0A4C1ZMX7_EUMVA|nr:hypothetical protein EVAR_62474_1 [Eumeta japonica]